MTPTNAELVRYRLARAQESLDESRLLLGGGHTNTAVNRLYYACFYAVSALLLASGMASSKHSGVMALFEQHWVKTGAVPVEQGRLYRSLFKHRQRGDYDDLITFEQGEVEDLLAQAEEFVRVVSEKAREMIEEA